MPIHTSEPSRPGQTDPNEREFGRLAIMQDDPRRFAERRTEYVELKDNRHYALRVEHQFTVPRHGESQSSKPKPLVERDLLITLGEFTKDRLPDLIVTGPHGERLPVASRSERGRIVATLYASKWQDVIFHGLPDWETRAAEELWSVVQISIAHIVTQPERLATNVCKYLFMLLDECSDSIFSLLGSRIQQLANEPAFRSGLEALVDRRLLIAGMRGIPGNNYVVTITYTEAMKTGSYGSGPIRNFLAWLGIIAMPISRQAANSGSAASFWTVASAPPGIEVLRLFWRNNRSLPSAMPSISVDASRAVVGRYQWSSDKAEDNELIFDVQIAPSAAVAGTIGLAAILLYVSRYVYQGFPRAQNGLEERTLLLTFGTLLVTIPAAIAGALAYRGEFFTRYASRGPRILVAILSVLGGLLAVTVTLKGLSTLTEVSAYALSVYCVFVIGIFGYIRLGFRWRHNDAARLLRWRKPDSPDHCRKKQTWAALIFFVAWIIVVAAFAKCQITLQHKHFFTAFPHEIIRALFFMIKNLI